MVKLVVQYPDLICTPAIIVSSIRRRGFISSEGLHFLDKPAEIAGYRTDEHPGQQEGNENRNKDYHQCHEFCKV